MPGGLYLALTSLHKYCEAGCQGAVRRAVLLDFEERQGKAIMDGDDLPADDPQMISMPAPTQASQRLFPVPRAYTILPTLSARCSACCGQIYKEIRRSSKPFHLILPL